MCLRLSSRHRQSSVSVVFDFSDSLNDFAPVAPISLSVDVMRKDKDELLMDVFLCVFFLLSSRVILNSVSVVFDFNDSLNDVAPVSLMLLSVEEKGKGKE